MAEVMWNGTAVVVELYLKYIYESRKTKTPKVYALLAYFFYRCITKISLQNLSEMWF